MWTLGPLQFDIYSTFVLKLVKRHFRTYGSKRKQLQEEIFTLFGLPSAWRVSASSGSSRSTRQIQSSNSRKVLDPTHAADSVFLLELYNELNENKPFDFVRYSKSALDLRKRKSLVPPYVSDIIVEMYYPSLV